MSCSNKHQGVNGTLSDSDTILQLLLVICSITAPPRLMLHAFEAKAIWRSYYDTARYQTSHTPVYCIRSIKK